MKLKNFQTNAINDLLIKSEKLFNKDGKRRIIFKSPTGSGKTIMLADYINRIIKDKIFKKPVSFIWTTPRRTLTLQSRNKLNKYLSSYRRAKCSFFEELIENNIPENVILFLNWESINKIDKNTIVIENEREFYLNKVLENTKDKGREIILIIDESHHHATSKISQKLIKDISPKLTLETSATPIMEDPDEIVSVSLEEVKIAGLIKKSVILNDKFKNLLSKNKIKSSLSDGSEKFVIDQAIKKQIELKKKYKEVKSKVNPLILIQLPDNLKGQQEDRFRIKIQEYIEFKYKIKTQNGKLAIHLSENKKNLENISKNENEVEILIFKQAIALGWDCPRAQILVLFRNWKSTIFSIQTVGRIMRMPEIKKGHYSKEILNYSYVFTNLKDIELKEDHSKNYFTIFTSFSRKKIKLISYSRTRQRERTRLSPLFIKIFLKEANKHKINKKINVINQKANFSMIIDHKVGSTDAMIDKFIKGKKYEIPNIEDLQLIFDYYIRNRLSPFFPEERSVGRLKEAIYNFFKLYLKIDYEHSLKKLINIVLSKNNINKFTDLIDIVKNEYVLQTEAKTDEIKENLNWNFPENITFTGDFIELKTKKSVMRPFYLEENPWKTEKRFINLLDNSKKVEYWFKNGDRDQTFFAIPYNYKKQINLFYVDFIVKFKSGVIGLFDTKSGITIDNSKEKNDGLQKYVQKRKKFVGGIVTNTDQENYKERWVIYDGPGKLLDSKKINNWKSLNI